ncbi:hypothetical protein HT102_03350 [Hoyosella sp. G463]|uniref:Uncharacterized protein n=1 Tax=Lolliginicoccus lacisalsi TaxID=2742202 RepID=A0A927JBT5_9ACTN|nr:hypothetical protein [Lolliginicoccus lacisalsi]MBD8505527.1 hypothetical protein [Lolliginicoccus lacisalsi]
MDVRLPQPDYSQGWSVYGGEWRVAVPYSFTVSATSGLEHEYGVTVDFDAALGKLVCSGCEARQIAGGPPVNSDALRRATVDAWVAWAGREAGLVHRISGEDRITWFSFPDAELFTGARSDESLRALSSVAAWCAVTGQKISGVMLDRYGLPRPSTTRWLAAARDKGLHVEEHLQF